MGTKAKEGDKRLGNRFWEKRTKHGRDTIFKDAEKLKEACIEYFEWVDDNPLYEAKLVSYEGNSKIENVPKIRAMTISGLSTFLDITLETWTQWRKDENKDFSDITKWADEIIRNQKFEGAAANLLNSNIIARDLGLKDTKENLNKEMAPTVIEDDIDGNEA